MKTLEDFVDRLNDKYRYLKYIFHERQNGDVIEIDNFGQIIMSFDKNGYHIEDNFSLLENHVQRYIINFLSTSDHENWFDRPLYNIVIAQRKGQDEYNTVAYSRSINGETIPKIVTENQLLDPLQQFNEIEIDELLDSQTDDRLRKIIQLGVIRVEEKWKQYKN